MSDLDVHLPAIVAGDADAFGAWMAGAEPTLRAGLRRFAAQVDAEAVLQEGLLRVWQVAPRFVPDGRPDGLLRLAQRIVRNVAISAARRHRVVLGLEADAEEAEPVRTPDPLLRAAIVHCRERLPARAAQALDARIAGGGAEPDETLAMRVGLTKNAFLQNFVRARTMLAECLKKRGVDLDAELA